MKFLSYIAAGILMFGSTCFGQGMRISAYPNTNNLGFSNLFIIAIKGTPGTNMNISWEQLSNLVNTSIGGLYILENSGVGTNTSIYSSLTVSGSNTITGNATASNFWDRSNVKWWGAKGDGVTDDTAPLQSAVASMTNGGRLYFPAGTYLLSSPLRITNSGITLTGAGAYYALLKMIAETNCLELTNVMTCHLQNLYLTGTNYSGSGIRIAGVSCLNDFRNLFIGGFSNGIYFAGATIANNQFGNCIAHANIANNRNGIASASNALGLTIIGPGIEIRDSLDAIKVGGINITIRDCIIESNTNGVSLWAGFNYRIHNNHFEANASNSIRLFTNSIISGLNIEQNLFNGLGTERNLMNEGAAISLLRWSQNAVGGSVSVTNIDLTFTPSPSTYAWSFDTTDVVGSMPASGASFGTDGLIGLGTFAPSQKLDVKGNIAIQPAGKIGSGPAYGGAIAADHYLQFYNYTDAGVTLSAGANGIDYPLHFSQLGQTRMTVSGGNVLITNASVAIGTNAPAATLQVAGNNAQPVFQAGTTNKPQQVLISTNGVLSVDPGGGVNPVGCYGFLGMNLTNLIVCAGAVDVYTNVAGQDGFTTITTNGFFGNKSAIVAALTNLYAGWYRVSLSISAKGANNQAVEGEIFTNGVACDLIGFKKTYDAASRMDAVNMTGIIYLPANCGTQFMVQDGGSGGSIIVHRAGLTIGTP